MENKNNQTKNFIGELLGLPTPAKAAGAVFTLASVVPVILAVVFMLITGALGLLTTDVNKQNWYIYANMLLVQFSFLLVSACYFYWTKIPLKTAITEQKCPFKYFIIAIILQFGLISLSSVNELFLQWLGLIGYEDSSMAGTEQLLQTSPFLLLLLVLAVLPAIFEEVIFRGLLFQGLRAFGTVGSVLLCGGLFSLYHQNPAQTIYQFCCGAAFALVVVRSGSILPTMLSHFLNNALVLILYNPEGTALPMPVFIVGLVCLIGALAYLIFIDKRVACTQAIEIKEAKKERKDFWIFAAIGIIICLVSWGTILLSGM
ncbi:MAG: CPBP family intramembrane metalloprotease [Clostridiales bacterium]|nr:CPBP family intramembrane metalloprotease [Clostridiales bacterium]